MQKFCISTWRLDAKAIAIAIAIAIFPLNSLQNQQQKMDHAEILHFNLDI